MDNETNDVRLAVDVASRAGKILLESGADITRVEDTINHMMRSFGVVNYDIFTLANGIFLSAPGAGGAILRGKQELPGNLTGDHVRIYNVPRFSTNLGRLDEVNSLSRGIEAGKYTLEQASERLVEIENTPPLGIFMRILSAGIAAGALCYMFGGIYTDAIISAVVSFLYYIVAIMLEKTKLSKLLTNALCGILLAFLTLIAMKTGLGTSMDKIIIGAIMPLIPGVSFVNAVRDIAAGDYISGSVRLIDAAVIAFGIATGVGSVLVVVNHFGLI